MSETVVEVKNLVKRYKELIALDNFNMTIRKGEVFGLLGPNGSGKTTTINCILSLLNYDNGEIDVFGEKMKSTRYDLKKKIGVVMQNVAVFDELTVYENIDYFCGLYITDKAERKQAVEDAIKFVGLEDFKKFKPKKLSGGLLRRLNIACGIAHKPELIIMDKGKNVAEGTSEELKRSIRNTENVIVDVRKLSDEHVANIGKLNHVYDVSYMSNRLTIKCSGGRHNISHVIDYFTENNLDYDRIYSELPTLNDVFLEITGKDLRDKEA